MSFMDGARLVFLCLSAIMIMIAPQMALADDLIVPDDFPLIQAAIDFAENGDAILVRRGTYSENLIIYGKSIRIEAPEGPTVTIIDGRAPTRPDTMSVVVVLSAENFSLIGFTIRNSLGGTDFGKFGGSAGGGLAFAGTTGTISNCVVSGNFCAGNGGGIQLVASDVLIVDSVIRDNLCGSNGGGIGAQVCSPTIDHCSITNNEAGPDGVGGGVFAVFGQIHVVGSRIERNRARAGAGIGALQSASPEIETALVADNVADLTVGTGAGVFCLEGSPRIESCTIVGNSAGLVSGVQIHGALNGAIRRSIVAFNTGGPGVDCSGSVTIECNDVYGNEGGNAVCEGDESTNFSLDPKLCSDRSISSSSPCAPENSPLDCELIGAFGVGCVDAVAAFTWGRIKHRYLGLPDR